MKRPIGFPIFSSESKRFADKNTILSEPIPSVDLLERACYQLAQYFIKNIDRTQHLHFVCGSGNNGADGLCLARILHFHGYKVKISCVQHAKVSAENTLQFSLLEHSNLPISIVQTADDLIIHSHEIIIDAILGSGLNKKLNGLLELIVIKINQSESTIYSIDNPTGIGSWDHFEGHFIMATKTFCLGSITPSLFNRALLQDIEVIDIGLNLQNVNPLGWYLNKAQSQDFIDNICPPIKKHDHKGSKGHVLLIGGNKGMHGAIVLSGQMANKIGTGNVSILSHPETLPYVSSIPEIQFKSAELSGKTTDFFDFGGYQSIGIGPGLDCTAATTAFLSFLLGKRNLPKLVIDADALNILSKNKALLPKIPKESILTPHPKELERLFGNFESENEKWKFLSEFSRKHELHILAKDTYSILFCSDGDIYVCGTGTSKLAKGGSGDKLTGLISGFMAQGLKTKHAAICGMFLLNELA